MNLTQRIAQVERAAQRLYGFDGDEYLQDSPEAVYERWADDYRPGEMLDPTWGRPAQLEIRRWTVQDPVDQVPSAEWILAWLIDEHADNAEYIEAGESFAKACRMPDVIAACEDLRRAIASHLTWKQADEVEGVHIVTWDDNHEPLLDGQPMYVTHE